MDTSYEKYLEEKALLEAYRHKSVITYEEWKRIKEEINMTSIDERAQEYAEIAKIRGDMSLELAAQVYIEIANEQRAIDIEKACRIQCSMCPLKCDIKDIYKATCAEIQHIIEVMKE